MSLETTVSSSLRPTGEQRAGDQRAGERKDGGTPARRPTTALVVSSSFPYPKDIGRRVMLGGMVEFLVRALGPENVCFAFLTAQPGEPLPPVDFEVKTIGIGSAVPRLARMFAQTFVLRRHALQEMAIFAPSAAGELAEITQARQPDHILFDTLRMAPYATALSKLPGTCRRYLYLDDLYSERYRRMLETMERFPEADLDVLGTFARFLPTPLGSLGRGRFLTRFLLRHESALMARREATMPGCFDEVLLISDSETEKFRAMTGANNIERINPWVEEPTDLLRRDFDGTPRFVFLGNLSYPANAQALRHFLSRVMPAALTLMPELRIDVIGRNAPQDLIALAAPFGDHVHFLGFVPSLADTLSRAAGMIIPLLYGTGVKLKTIDALAHGLPIVSTPLGIEGTVLRHDLACLIAGRPEEFPELMHAMLDRQTNARLSAEAAAIFQREYSDAALDKAYRAIFRIGAPAGSEAAGASSDP